MVWREQGNPRYIIGFFCTLVYSGEPKVVFHTIKQMSEQEWNEVHGTETKELNSVKALN